MGSQQELEGLSCIRSTLAGGVKDLVSQQGLSILTAQLKLSSLLLNSRKGALSRVIDRGRSAGRGERDKAASHLLTRILRFTLAR